ncbi:hypothetical protein GCM10017673_07720 [Streptosporangium violaceochromogenes]|nr:hypothetical protein GCM10017673_07720 [Streptosporangium violaceochromogenes]
MLQRYIESVLGATFGVFMLSGGADGVKEAVEGRHVADSVKRAFLRRVTWSEGMVARRKSDVDHAILGRIRNKQRDLHVTKDIDGIRSVPEGLGGAFGAERSRLSFLAHMPGPVAVFPAYRPFQ